MAVAGPRSNALDFKIPASPSSSTYACVTAFYIFADNYSLFGMSRHSLHYLTACY